MIFFCAFLVNDHALTRSVTVAQGALRSPDSWVRLHFLSCSDWIICICSGYTPQCFPMCNKLGDYRFNRQQIPTDVTAAWLIRLMKRRVCFTFHSDYLQFYNSWNRLEKVSLCRGFYSTGKDHMHDGAQRFQAGQSDDEDDIVMK